MLRAGLFRKDGQVERDHVVHLLVELGTLDRWLDLRGVSGATLGELATAHIEQVQVLAAYQGVTRVVALLMQLLLMLRELLLLLADGYELWMMMMMIIVVVVVVLVLVVVGIAASSAGELLRCGDYGLDLPLLLGQHARVVRRDHVRVRLRAVHLRRAQLALLLSIFLLF